jgi:hypothetical protein
VQRHAVRQPGRHLAHLDGLALEVVQHVHVKPKARAMQRGPRGAAERRRAVQGAYRGPIGTVYRV